MNTDKAKAMEINKFVSFNFDKQAILETPKLLEKPVFYKRKLHTYNETFYDVSTKGGYCYLWHESEGKRGANEVATITYNHIKNIYTEAEEISMFTDTCGGENRNIMMSTMCTHIVQELPNLKIVNHKYFEPGHSCMEADYMHSCIKKRASKSEIQTPYDWDNVCRLARYSNPYKVQRLSHGDFQDWSAYAQSRGWTNFKTNTNKEKVHWLKIRMIQYEKSSPDMMKYKYSFSPVEEYKTIILIGRRSSAR